MEGAVCRLFVRWWSGRFGQWQSIGLAHAIIGDFSQLRVIENDGLFRAEEFRLSIEDIQIKNAFVRANTSRNLT